MNCPKCGSQLNEFSTCPMCGYHNEEIIELEDTPIITENMAPPTLEVEKDDLTSGAGDLTADVSTYQEEEKTVPEENEISNNGSVDIAIPQVEKPVTNIDMPKDGSAPEVEVKSTVGGDEREISKTPIDVTNKGSKLKHKILLATGSKTVSKKFMYVVVAVFLIIGILIGKAMFSKNYCATTSTKSLIKKTTKFVSDGKNNTTNIGEYTYLIPEEYIYDKKDGGLLIYDKDDTFRIFIRTENAIYDDLTVQKSSIRETLKANDMTVNNTKEMKVKDTSFLIFETTLKMVNRLVSFADASNDYVFYVEIVTKENNYGYEVLDIVEDILKNAKYEEVESTMETIEVKDIAKEAIKAAIEAKNINTKS